MIIGVTGATGFIGKKLIDACLFRGYKVRVYSRRPLLNCAWADSVQLYQGDLLVGENLLEFVDGLDVLYNCAGEIRNEQRMDALHVKSVKKLAEVASGRIGHWVQLSSVGVYGAVRSGVVSESSPIMPVGLYEITKAESDKIVMHAANQGGFSYSILRPSNVYGATMANQSLFNMIAMIHRGLFFYIGKIGASANYIHVDNVVDGLLLCGSHPFAKGRIFNLSDHRTLECFVDTISHSLKCSAPLFRLPYALANALANTLGKIPAFPLTASRVNALTNRSTYPISLIEDELDYQYIMSMEDGLSELVEAYKQRAASKI